MGAVLQLCLSREGTLHRTLTAVHRNAGYHISLVVILQITRVLVYYCGLLVVMELGT